MLNPDFVIFEAQGGRIWLEPNDGRGALIRFTLPGAQTVGE
jgi:signal transduction histidine kinase